MLTITTERRCAWLRAISREDLVGDKLKNTFVCEIGDLTLQKTLD